jgi:hypothetical protein
LLLALSEAISRRGQPGLALADTPAEAVTHRGLITVENAAVSLRPHHLHHRRAGVLAATLTITNAPGPTAGTTLLVRRASAELTAPARELTAQEVLAALVDKVVARWMTALEEPLLERLLNRRERP